MRVVGSGVGLWRDLGPRPQTSQVGNCGTRGRWFYGESSLPRTVTSLGIADFLMRSLSSFSSAGKFFGLIMGAIECLCPAGAELSVFGASGSVARMRMQRRRVVMLTMVVMRRSCLAGRGLAGSGST